jgi:hypothetical protein
MPINSVLTSLAINSVLTSLAMYVLSFFEVGRGILHKLDY